VESVANATTLTDAMSRLVRLVCQSIHVDCCSVYLVDTKHHTYQLAATEGLHQPKSPVILTFQEGLIGLVGRHCEPIRLTDAQSHPDYKNIPQLNEQAFRAFLGTPIIHQRQLLGVLVIQQKVCREFSDSEESFLVTLAAQLAGLLAHAKTQGAWLTPKLNAQTAFEGISAAQGIGVGVAHWAGDLQFDAIFPASCLDAEVEKRHFQQALHLTRHEFMQGRQKLDKKISSEVALIFDWYVQLLDDKTFQDRIEKYIDEQQTAAWAVTQTVQFYCRQFEAMSDVYLRARQFDIKELGLRILHFLSQYQPELSLLEYPHVLCVRSITALLLTKIDPNMVLAIIALEGAENSHAAILARALGIPTVMGLDLPIKRLQGKTLVVDGYQGRVVISPNSALLKVYQDQQAEDNAWQHRLAQGSSRWGRTKDGVRLDVHLNLSLESELKLGDKGIDGIGLYRTEMPFLLSDGFPSEESQVKQYRSILSHYPKKDVVMRTLDIGGDKPLPYFPMTEENPFLGWRGMRFTLDHPEIFLIQLRAMLKASVGLNNLSILFPMISCLSEVDEALLWFERAYAEVQIWAKEHHLILFRPKLGVMLEVPALIYQLPYLPKSINFLSIGTNDLTQYLLAVDRNNAQVASVYDACHPSVLLALRYIQDHCAKTGLTVTVCGEMAGDPVGSLLLVGLGYRRLSMNRGNMATVKYVLRHFTLSSLVMVANQACRARDHSQVREEMHQFMSHYQLSRFIRERKK
jgi:phosphotransferase system enzyme I (PtsP)